MLALPAETPDAGAAVTLENRDHHCHSALVRGLLVANGEKGAIRDRLDKTVTERARRNSKCPRRIGVGHKLDDIRVGRPRMYQRAPERFVKLAVLGAARASD